MLKKMRFFILLAFLGAAGYFFLSYHIIFFGNTVKLLNKSKFTSDYTFINASNKSAEFLMRIDTLREADIGKVLVEMGRLSKEDEESMERKFDSDPVYY